MSEVTIALYPLFDECFFGCFAETRVNEREANDSQSDKEVEKEEHGGGQGDNLIRHRESCHGDDTKPRPPSSDLEALLRLFLQLASTALLKEHRSISRETPKCQVSQHHRPLTYDHPRDAPLHELVFNFRQGRDLSMANTEREQGKRFPRRDVKRSPHVKILDWFLVTLFDEVFETFYLRRIRRWID
ncbi:hypothetical protein K0M31_009434 [Melipona bicolor]|uniref:Uncharacterized protein n=1 Tax=Melipona bicolor TaxID=60889 RepID=A0AA40KJ10_9HYME|nr:hypothetical protein K0M31_009434 [Melipona bicolor]